MSKFKIVREILFGILAGAVVIASCYKISKEQDETIAKHNAKVAECRNKGGYYNLHEGVCLPRIPLDSENSR